MTYIQRLFKATAPAMGMSVSVPAVVSTVATSPILAADQRLGMFPGLIDPFTPAPLPPQAPHGETAPSAPTSRVPAPRPAAQVPQHRPAPQTDPSQQPAKATPRPAPQMPNPEPAAAAVPPPAQPSPVKSLLQRLVEADPLPAPARPTAPPPIQDLRTGDHPRPTAQQQSQHRPLAQSPAATQIPAAAPPVMRNPTVITPDQFQPARVDGQQNVVPAAKFAPTPTPAPAPPPIAQQSQTPLQPTARESASPFARRVDLPPPPAQQQPANTPPPERIIERIRDVPVAPAPPPKAMTAAAQSVIGPLSQRGAGRWQSRQEV